MQIETILKGLESESFDKQLRALDFCIVDESLLADKEIINIVFNFLNHKNHFIRNQAEEVLSFYIGHSSESKEDLIKRIGRSPDKGDAVSLAFYQSDAMFTASQMSRMFVD